MKIERPEFEKMIRDIANDKKINSRADVKAFGRKVTLFHYTSFVSGALAAYDLMNSNKLPKS